MMFEKIRLICEADAEGIVEIAKFVARDDLNFFRGARLDDLDLRGEDFRGFDLSGATFFNAEVDETTYYDQRFAKIIAEQATSTLAFNPFLLKKIKELNLSKRSTQALLGDDIVYIGDLIQKTDAEMLRTPNLGRKSLNEIKELLASMGLHLGMEVYDWPPENIVELAEEFKDEF